MASIDSLKLELARQVEGEVRFDAGTRAAYATDASKLPPGADRRGDSASRRRP